MLTDLFVSTSCWCMTYASGGTVGPTSAPELNRSKSSTDTGVAKREETSLSPIIITCVILSLIFFAFILLLHFIRTRGCDHIVNSFKVKNYQMKFSLPKISFKNRKQKSIASQPTSIPPPKVEATHVTVGEDPSIITEDKATLRDDAKVMKRSSRLFDAIRSTLKRNSSTISMNNPLLTVHREVASFEQEALTLLTKVMTKHLTEEEEEEEEVEEHIPKDLHELEENIISSSSSRFSSPLVEKDERRSSLLSAVRYSDDSDGECEVTFLDDSDGGLVTTL